MSKFTCNHSRFSVSFLKYHVLFSNSYAHKIVYRYEIKVPPSSLETGRLLSNGSWTGAFGLIQRKVLVQTGRVLKFTSKLFLNLIWAKEVDMCITFAPPSINMKEEMDFSYYVLEDDISIVIPYPTRQTNKFGTLFTTFEIKVKFMRLNFTHYTFKILFPNDKGLDLLDRFGIFCSLRFLGHCKGFFCSPFNQIFFPLY